MRRYQFSDEQIYQIWNLSGERGCGNLKATQQSRQQILIIFKNLSSKSFKVLQEGFKYWQVLKLAKKIDCPPMIPENVQQLIKKGCWSTEDINFLMKKKKILTTLSALETKGLSNLCDRTEIQKKSLFRYVKQKYAAHVLQRYLLLLRHLWKY